MDKITITLTTQEALVLLELLSRWAETDAMAVVLEHQAEQRVLWDILAQMESMSAEPFLPDYLHRLQEARTGSRR